MAELSELDFYKLQYTGQQVDTALGQILNGEVQQAVEDAQAAAEEAQAAQAAVENLGVAADSLPSTALARVTKTVGADGAVTLTFGIPRGATGAAGPAGPRGNPGVAVATDGLWALHIDSEGHLILDYDGDTPPDLEIDENGHLIYTVNGQTVDLGQVTGGGGTAGVSSFKGRTGAVVPQSSDYTAEMVGAVSAHGASEILITPDGGQSGYYLSAHGSSMGNGVLALNDVYGSGPIRVNGVKYPEDAYDAANKGYVDRITNAIQRGLSL